MAFIKPTNFYKAHLEPTVSVAQSPVQAHSDMGVKLRLLTTQMIINHATIKIPHTIHPLGKSAPDNQLNGVASANKNIITIDIPDPNHPETASAIAKAQIEIESSHGKEPKQPVMNIPNDAPLLHFVGPNVGSEKLADVASGFSYLPGTKDVTHIYADNFGAANRAIVEAHRLGLHVDEDKIEVSRMDDYKPFLKSHEVKSAINKFQESINKNDQRIEHGQKMPHASHADLKISGPRAPPESTAAAPTHNNNITSVKLPPASTSKTISPGVPA